MNLTRKIANISLVAFAIMMAACGNDTNSTTAVAVAADGTEVTPIIRYIDGDSLMAKYNLAKDISEAMLRRTSQLDAEQSKREDEINRFASEMQDKYQNNRYLSQAAIDADQKKLSKMQSDGQAYLTTLQRDAQNEMMQYQIQLNDSIDNFLKEFAAENGYDVILNKSASLYIAPKYDVTNAVIEGLNKRYNKVAKQ